MSFICKYRFLEHPSDIKIRAYGNTLSEVFINAASGMMAYIYGKHQIANGTSKYIEVSADNLESLLINWLSQILALSNISHGPCVSFTIKEFDKLKIIAETTLGKSRAHHEIKAVTYHELSLKQTKNGWVATVVYDI